MGSFLSIYFYKPITLSALNKRFKLFLVSDLILFHSDSFSRIEILCFEIKQNLLFCWVQVRSNAERILKLKKKFLISFWFRDVGLKAIHVVNTNIMISVSSKNALTQMIKSNQSEITNCVQLGLLQNKTRNELCVTEKTSEYDVDSKLYDTRENIKFIFFEDVLPIFV